MITSIHLVPCNRDRSTVTSSPQPSPPAEERGETCAALAIFAKLNRDRFTTTSSPQPSPPAEEREELRAAELAISAKLAVS
jgi:hypothetical protein